MKISQIKNKINSFYTTDIHIKSFQNRSYGCVSKPSDPVSHFAAGSSSPYKCSPFKTATQKFRDKERYKAKHRNGVRMIEPVCVTERNFLGQISTENSDENIKGSLIQANYNMSFCGILDNKNLKYIKEDTTLKPKQTYIIPEDANLYLGDFSIDLSEPVFKEQIKQLKPGEEIYLGKESKELNCQNYNVERKHAKLSRDKAGNLTVKDLNSRYGTIVQKNIIEPYIKSDAPIELIPGINYRLPVNSNIQLGDDIYIVPEDFLPYMKDNTPYIIGKSRDCDFTTDEMDCISDKHLSLTKTGNKMYVKDLNSKEGSRFCGLDKKQFLYPDDYTELTSKELLRENVITVIPENCQLLLGNNFTIDLRDKNLKSLLEERGKLTVGTDSNSDIPIDKINNSVSSKQVILRKLKNKITATAINTDYSDVIFIPENKIQAFYNGTKNIKIANNMPQDNIITASLFALSQLYLGQLRLRDMVQSTPEGNYIVTFYNNPPFIITQKELAESKTSGDSGIKAIVCAFKKFKEQKYPDKQITPEDIIYTLTGLKCKHINLKKYNKKKLLKELADKQETMNLTIAQTKAYGYYDKNTFMDLTHFFKANHYYVINKINKEAETIEITDSEDTSIKRKIHWWEFPFYFGELYTTTELKYVK